MNEDKIISFRPLSGSYISQLYLSHSFDAVVSVSVPYRGATFLNKDNSINRITDACFRPLSGSYISQY